MMLQIIILTAMLMINIDVGMCPVLLQIEGNSNRVLIQN